LHVDGKALRGILAAQRQFVVDLGIIPDASGEFCDRGRDRASNEYAEKGYKPETAEEREAIEIARKSRAGTISRANERAINCGLIAEEIERRMALGRTIEEVIEAKADVLRTLVASGNVSRPTAYRRFDEVAAIVSEAARYQAMRSSAQSDTPHQPDPAPAVSPVTDAPAPVQNVVRLRRVVVQRPEGMPESEFRSCQRASGTLDRWKRAVESWRDGCRRRAAIDDDEGEGLDFSSPVDLSFVRRRRLGAFVPTRRAA
jgi:hypothetical protein